MDLVDGWMKEEEDCATRPGCLNPNYTSRVFAGLEREHEEVG